MSGRQTPKSISKDKIYLAEVDATVHKNLAVRFGIRGYPTMIFFKDGVEIPYDGGRTEEALIKWTKEYSEKELIAELKEANQLKEFKEKDYSQAEMFINTAYSLSKLKSKVSSAVGSCSGSCNPSK